MIQQVVQKFCQLYTGLYDAEKVELAALENCQRVSLSIRTIKYAVLILTGFCKFVNSRLYSTNEQITELALGAERF